LIDVRDTELPPDFHGLAPGTLQPTLHSQLQISRQSRKSLILRRPENTAHRQV
jgi:hypothetical protein